MSLIPDPTPILSDLETIWAAIDSFYQEFSPQDWSRKHGKDWTFADIPYHLAYFNQMVLDGVRDDHQHPAPLTVEQLNSWNDQQFARRSASHAGAHALDYLHETQAALRQAAEGFAPETPVFMPLIMVGGWRTLSFALEYLLNHSWTHFTESHLRRTGRLAILPARLVHRALDFNMEGVAGVLMPGDLAGVDLVTGIRLTGSGGGEWTFTMRDGRCAVEPQAAAKADGELTTDIATYMNITYYGKSSVMTLLTGKVRIKGMSNVQQFQKLFAVTPSRMWNFVQRGKTEPA